MIVEWHEIALDRLADIYVRVPGSERDALVRCVEDINARLAIEPALLGELHGVKRRVWFNRPLMVVFDVESDRVLVVHVALVRSDPDD